MCVCVWGVVVWVGGLGVFEVFFFRGGELGSMGFVGWEGSGF